MNGNPTTLYILYSPSLNRYYTGITSDEVELRLRKHNTAGYGKHYTSAASDWEPQFVMAFQSYTAARKAELFIKKMKSRTFILKLIDNKAEQDLFALKFNST